MKPFHYPSLSLCNMHITLSALTAHLEKEKKRPDVFYFVYNSFEVNVVVVESSRYLLQ